MSKPRTSPVWRMPEQEFIALVASNRTISAILNHFALTNKGCNYKTVACRIRELGLNTDHFGSDGTKANIANSYRLEDVMIENSSYSRTTLKKRLIKNGLLKEICSVCNQPSTWNKEPLTMVLDHINGKSNDNRIENLRLACPNCNSQLPTFCSKNMDGARLMARRIRKATYLTCITCQKQFLHRYKGKLTKFCSYACRYSNPNFRKFNIAKEELAGLVQRHSLVAIGKMFNVSDNAIKKRCKLLGVESWRNKRASKEANKSVPPTTTQQNAP